METPHMFKHLALAAASAGLIACGGTTTEPTPEAGQPVLPEAAAEYTQGVVSVSEMMASSPDGRVVIDLRSTTQGFHVERSVDFAAVDVICPSNRVMNLKQWVPELASEFQTSTSSLRDGFVMFSSMSNENRGEVQAQKIPPCYDPCYLHGEPDRTWVCFC
jgi:hypothetical protein